jgi:hypothetical protein
MCAQTSTDIISKNGTGNRGRQDASGVSPGQGAVLPPQFFHNLGLPVAVGEGPEQFQLRFVPQRNTGATEYPTG